MRPFPEPSPPPPCPPWWCPKPPPPNPPILYFVLPDGSSDPYSITLEREGAIQKNTFENQTDFHKFLDTIDVNELGEVDSITIVASEIDSKSAINSLDYIVEKKLFPDFNFEISGNDEANNLSGENENNILIDNGGNDILIGGNGDNILVGGDGNDIFVSINGNDIIEGNAGSDTFELGADGSGFATIVDFDRAEGDLFQVEGSQNDYTLSFGNVSGDSAVDTIIEYQGYRVAVAVDTVAVDLNTDFVFL